MMYNRYIPQSNGIYKRHSIEIPDIPNKQHTPALSQEEKTSSAACVHKPLKDEAFGTWDLGDLLLLCIAVLLLLESEEDDILPILVAIAAFVFIQ